MDSLYRLGLARVRVARQPYAFKTSSDTYLRVAAYQVIASDDIFDSDPLEDSSEQDLATQPLIQFLENQDALKGVAWKIRNNFGDLAGFKGGKMHVIHVLRDFNNDYRWIFQSSWGDYRISAATVDKNILKNVSALMDRWHGKDAQWEYLKGGVPVEADTNSGSKGRPQPLKDILARLGVFGKIVNKAPIITLRAIQDASLYHRKNYTDNTVEYPIQSYQVEIGINGREWVLDPDTVDRLLWNTAAFPGFSANVVRNGGAGVTVEMNKQRSYPVGRFASELLDNLTREPTDFIIELSKVVEWFEDNGRTAGVEEASEGEVV